jgi:hypothetical protein
MEGMLVGAAIGGGTALLTGEDVLTGALIGAGTAGLTSGAQGLLGATNTAALTGVDSVVDATVDTALDTAVQNTAQGTIQNGVIQGANTGLNVAGTVNPALTSNAGTLAANNGITGLGGMQAIPQATQVASSGLGGLNAPVSQGGLSIGTATANDAAQVAAKPGLMDRISTGYSNLSDMEKLGVGIGGGALLSSAMAPSGVEELDDKYKGPLSKFKYSPDSFTPSRAIPNVYQARYAQGGIAALAGGGYPMGRQDNTQFATPTQMPTSAEVVNADYEAATDPYTGSPVRMFGGGDTATASPSMGSMFGGGDRASPSMGGLGMLSNAFRNGLMGGQLSPSFRPAQVAPANIYRQAAPIQAMPARQQPIRRAMPNYSLDDSMALLRATNPGMAEGGIAGYSLGGYAAGGNPRLLKGPGDGMSDDIPATIANKQPARLADGEFVVPADVVSHLGNGSTDAGAKHLYKMMDNVRKARTGKKAQGKQIKSEKFLPK